MMFANLKTVFDKDRGKLWDCLRKKEISESLVRRIEKIYEETEITIRTKLENTESFVTKRGVMYDEFISFQFVHRGLKRKI